MDRPRASRPFVRRAILGVALMAAVYAVLAVLSDVRTLADVVGNFRWWAFGAGLLLCLGAFALRALRWFLYLRRLDVWHLRGPRPVTFREALGMSLATGKAGHVVKSYYLSEAAGVPYSLSITAGLAERMSDVCAIVILLLIGIVLAPTFGWTTAAAAAAVLVGFLLLLRWEGTGHLVVRLVRRIPRLADWAHHVEAAHAHLRPMLHVKPLAAPVALGLAGFALEATAMWIMGNHGLRLHLTWGEAAFVLGAVDVAGTISLMPGGLGVIDGGIVILLHQFLNVPLAPATALALLTRMCTLWLSGLLDVVSFGLLRGLQPAPRRAASPSAGPPPP